MNRLLTLAAAIDDQRTYTTMPDSAVELADEARSLLFRLAVLLDLWEIQRPGQMDIHVAISDLSRALEGDR